MAVSHSVTQIRWGTIGAYLVYRGAPPAEAVRSFYPEHSEEYDDCRNGDGAVERRAQHESVSFPPCNILLLNVNPKEKSNNSPATIVRCRSRRQVIQTAEQQRHGCMSPETVRVAPLERIYYDRKYEAKSEEVQEGVVGRACRKRIGVDRQHPRSCWCLSACVRRDM